MLALKKDALLHYFINWSKLSRLDKTIVFLAGKMVDLQKVNLQRMSARAFWSFYVQLTFWRFEFLVS
jgi:hypothetical protein